MKLSPKILKALEQGDYSQIDQWIEGDEEKAKAIYRIHRSLGHVRETHHVIEKVLPSLWKKQADLSLPRSTADSQQNTDTPVEKFLEKINIVAKESKLLLRIGEHLLMPKLAGIDRSGDDSKNSTPKTELQFKDFGVTFYAKHFNLYFKSFTKSLEIEKNGRIVLSYFNEYNLNVPLAEGEYILHLNQKLFYLNLSKE